MNLKAKSLAKDVLIFAVGSLGSKLLLFLMVPLYTNYLTTEEYGIAELIFTVAQFVIPFVSVVIFDAVLRFGVSKNENKEDVLLVAVIVFLISIPITIISSYLCGFYSTIGPWRWYLCIYIIFNVATSVELNYLKAKEKNKLYSVVSILNTGSMAALNILFLVYMNMGVRGYLIAYIVANGISSLILFLLGGLWKDLRKSKLKKELIVEMLKYSSPLILNNVSWWAIHSSDKIMIELMVSASALGLYTVAAKIPSLINVFISIFSQAWGISSIKEIENSQDNVFLSQVFSTYSVFVCGICLAFNTIIKPFMSIYVGQSFQGAWKYVPLLLVAAVLSAISAYYGGLYGALKKSINNMLTTFAAAIANIIVNYWMIQIIGIWGAIVGTVTAYLVLSISRILDINRYQKLQINWIQMTSSILIVFLQAILVSLDWHIAMVSIVSIVAFTIINIESIKAVCYKTKSLIKNMIHRKGSV